MSSEIRVPARAYIVTKSDTAANSGTSLYVGGTGDVNLVTAGGDTVLYSAVPVGTTIYQAFKQILSTSTTATLMVARF